MSKKVLALLLACIMCFAVVFTGCANDGEEANTGNNDNEQVGTEIGNNEQVSTDNGGITEGIGGIVEDVIFDVVKKEGPSSKRVEELAKKGEMSFEDI